LRTFTPGRNLSFDEGGVASRSRVNPVRQYNKDKPNKFRIDFFVLTNNTKREGQSEIPYFIMHLDVYQGKNAANIGIPNEIRHLPTTQKAVINAIIAAGLGKDPDGLRCLFMDNRYTCAQLLLMLRELYDILGSGTTRKNRKGWPRDEMTLGTSPERGASVVVYDKINEILCCQWFDNKVVSCTSTLGVSGLVPVSRRSGARILQLTVEKSLRMYQMHMDGVDRADQYREMGAGFATKGHFKKWYKKAYFAVMDFMLLNSFFAWNMSVAENPTMGRLKLKKWQFYSVVAHEMMTFVDDGVHDDEEDEDESGDGWTMANAKIVGTHLN